MSRIDWLVLGRLGSRIGVTVFVFYGLIALVESLDTWRFNFVAEAHGLHPEPPLEVPATLEHVGSTVVMLRG